VAVLAAPQTIQMINQIFIKQLFKGIFKDKNIFLCNKMPFCQEKMKIERKII